MLPKPAKLNLSVMALILRLILPETGNCSDLFLLAILVMAKIEHEIYGEWQ